MQDKNEEGSVTVMKNGVQINIEWKLIIDGDEEPFIDSYLTVNLGKQKAEKFLKTFLSANDFDLLQLEETGRQKANKTVFSICIDNIYDVKDFVANLLQEI
jgi:hypothetical protein